MHKKEQIYKIYETILKYVLLVFYTTNTYLSTLMILSTMRDNAHAFLLFAQVYCNRAFADHE